MTTMPDKALVCACPLTAGSPVKARVDDGVVLLTCPACGRPVSLETVAVFAAPRTVDLALEYDEAGRPFLTAVLS